MWAHVVKDNGLVGNVQISSITWPTRFTIINKVEVPNFGFLPQTDTYIWVVCSQVWLHDGFQKDMCLKGIGL